MRGMPSKRAASSWVSPKVRRRLRKAERIHACESSPRRIGFSSDCELNNPAPIAAPSRADFDRYPNDPASLGAVENDNCKKIIYCQHKMRFTQLLALA